ncbi:MAG: SCO family protein [Candidatus Marinimicrobia bacterium]|nr:SCO family protein [Candidatus Neomarinimicrobiota bacterium]MBO01034.1 SCO family protein [Candidatus Neomarinimicrobiota bacterium]|tara:strand:+ start:68 stop:652 length:585 start_codon:yes stop_codon:yes gene_type:complete
MNFKTRLKIYIGIAIFLIITFFVKDSQPSQQLPKIGSIPQFEFIDSNGNTVTLNNLKGKVWVADFIFTTCTMACPMMTGNMNLVHKKFKKNDDVRLVSISVYPEYDTPDVLKEYASQYDADTEKWLFLTGDESSVKNIIKDGFKIGDFEEIIFHSEKFALVDKNGTIRAYYNGMKSEDMKQLKKDINALLKQDA